MKGKGFIKALLTITSIGSFIKVIYDAGKAAIEARPEIDRRKEANFDHKLNRDDYIFLGKTYGKDVAIDAAVNLGSTVLLGAINHAEIKTLTATAATLSGAYAKYRNNLKKLYGSNIDNKVKNADKIFETRSKAPYQIERRADKGSLSQFDMGDEGNQFLFYSALGTQSSGIYNDPACKTGTWFRATIPEVQGAEIELVRYMDIYGDVTLQDYYSILGIVPHTTEEQDYAKHHVWSAGAIADAFDYMLVNFRYEKKVRDDGTPYYEITSIEPLLPVGESDTYPMYPVNIQQAPYQIKSR